MKMHLLSEAVQHNLILFTSTGLWGLTLNSRYTHALCRLREFHDAHCAQPELDMMTSRCRWLKWSFICLIISVLTGIVHAFSIALSVPGAFSTTLTGFYCLFLFASMLCLLIDVIKSANTTLFHLGKIQ